MSRRGMSMVELLVVSAAAGMVTWAMFTLLRGGTRMSRATSMTVALQNALFLEDVISRDLCQLGIDPARSAPYLIGPSSVSFYRTSFEGNRTLLVPVKFSYLPGKKGTGYLQRSELVPGKPLAVKSYLNAPLGELVFSRFQDPMFKTTYLKVQMTLQEGDRSLPHTVVMRIPTHSQVGNPNLSQVVRFLTAAELLPL